MAGIYPLNTKNSEPIITRKTKPKTNKLTQQWNHSLLRAPSPPRSPKQLTCIRANVNNSSELTMVRSRSFEQNWNHCNREDQEVRSRRATTVDHQDQIVTIKQTDHQDHSQLMKNQTALEMMCRWMTVHLNSASSTKPMQKTSSWQSKTLSMVEPSTLKMESKSSSLMLTHLLIVT